jgi:hypothetical protein
VETSASYEARYAPPSYPTRAITPPDTQEEVTNPKPHPESVLGALRLLDPSGDSTRVTSYSWGTRRWTCKQAEPPDCQPLA